MKHYVEERAVLWCGLLCWLGLGILLHEELVATQIAQLQVYYLVTLFIMLVAVAAIEVKSYHKRRATEMEID